jgi:hypothetical protein
MTLQYAGANNSLYLIKKKQLPEATGYTRSVEKNGHILHELPPDPQPIGKQAEKEPFTDKTVQIQQGDTFYIFSDGYPDQFGGPRGKKFMYKQFRQLLLNIQHKPMNGQKEILNQTIVDWMAQNDEEQIDDICVLGVRIA